MSRQEHHAGARSTIEAHTRYTLATAHAIFTWSIADAVEAVLEHLSLPANSLIAVPLSAPPAIHRAIRAMKHAPHLVQSDPASLGMCPVALQETINRHCVRAVVAWRPAGNRHAPDLFKVLAAADVPVIDASPRMPLGPQDRLRNAVATCISLARPTLPAAILATDDDALARLAGERRLGVDVNSSSGRDTAHLDRWASTASAHLSHDPLTNGDVARSYQLLFDTVNNAPETQRVVGPVMGWGEGPTLLVAYPDAATLQAAVETFGDIGAIQLTRWPDGLVVDGAIVEHAGDPWSQVLTYQLTRAMTTEETQSIVSRVVTGVSSGATRRADEDGSFGIDVHVHQGRLVRATKRAFDIVAGSLLIVACAPLMLAISLLVWLAEGEAVIFRQIRVGRHGQHFVMLKFQTMVDGADQMIDEYREVNERHGPLFKLSDDPRATMVGRILRRTSLDELPQLFNVVGGTMSLVGPRPALPAEQARFSPALRLRECVRPGITGLWQVEARDDLSFERYATLDLAYVNTHSLKLDLSILSRTPSAVYATAMRRPSRTRREVERLSAHPTVARSPRRELVLGRRARRMPNAVSPHRVRRKARHIRFSGVHRR